MDDFSEILNDEDTGGVACMITSPAGVSLPFNAMHSDIHQPIDLGTGEVVTGRQVHVTVIIGELMAAGFWGNADSDDNVHGVVDTNRKPWVVTIVNANGITGAFKVVETHPSESLGRVTLILECYVALK